MAAPVLSYGDVLLRQQDVDLLRGPHWLNDQLIAFGFTFIERQASSGCSAAFCGGSLTYLLSQVGPEDAAAILAPLDVAAKQLVFFAVNDNPDCQTANGGSHWSLLVFSAADGTFRHFDSAGGANARVAQRLAAVLLPVLRPGSLRVPFEEPAVPRQANGHDCGLHVLTTAHAICGLFEGSWDYALQELQEQLAPDAIAGWRPLLLGMVETMASKQVACDVPIYE